MAAKHCLTARSLIALLALTLLVVGPHHISAGQNPPPIDRPAVQVRRQVWLPHLGGAGQPGGCPVTGASYQAIPVLPPPTDRPAAEHADLNFALRGALPTSAALTLVDYNGPTDTAAPQLPGLFTDHRTPRFVSTHRVYDWNWGCGPNGCRAAPIAAPPVTLLGLAARLSEQLYAPARGPEIFAGDYVTLVLYAEAHRLTLKYTREDNVVRGYTVHLEGLCVDPDLLTLYQQSDAAGRAFLPGVRNGQPVGVAHLTEIRVAIRDSGAFLDPRSRKDWWQGH